jgi:anthranilate phosphoribosyltransferase
VEIVDKVLTFQSLTFDEARLLLEQIQQDALSDEQLRSILLALRAKGETVDEVAGFASVMRDSAVPLHNKPAIVVDTAGTGGDGLNTFNISTAAAFVIAGAGIPVAKHGNRGASSPNGSADVMAALGVSLDLTPEAVEVCLNELGIAFLFAPKFHRATARVAQVRRELGVKTIFNLLGPLTNPARVRRQVIGVCSREIADQIVVVSQRLGSDHVWVVSGDDGADELSVTAPSYISEFKNGEFASFELVPEELGFERGEIEDLRGGDARQNAASLQNILVGTDQSTRRDVVILNAAAGIYVGGATSFDDALRRAQNSLDDGAAYEKLQGLIETSRKLSHPPIVHS